LYRSFEISGRQSEPRKVNGLTRIANAGSRTFIGEVVLREAYHTLHRCGSRCDAGICWRLFSRSMRAVVSAA